MAKPIMFISEESKNDRNSEVEVHILKGKEEMISEALAQSAASNSRIMKILTDALRKSKVIISNKNICS